MKLPEYLAVEIGSNKVARVDLKYTSFSDSTIRAYFESSLPAADSNAEQLCELVNNAIGLRDKYLAQEFNSFFQQFNSVDPFKKLMPSLPPMLDVLPILEASEQLSSNFKRPQFPLLLEPGTKLNSLSPPIYFDAIEGKKFAFELAWPLNYQPPGRVLVLWYRCDDTDLQLVTPAFDFFYNGHHHDHFGLGYSYTAPMQDITPFCHTGTNHLRFISVNKPENLIFEIVCASPLISGPWYFNGEFGSITPMATTSNYLYTYGHSFIQVSPTFVDRNWTLSRLKFLETTCIKVQCPLSNSAIKRPVRFSDCRHL